MNKENKPNVTLLGPRLTPEEFEEKAKTALAAADQRARMWWRRYILFEYIPKLCLTILWILGVCFSLLLLFAFIRILI